MESGKLVHLLYGRGSKAPNHAFAMINPVAANTCHARKAMQNRNCYEFTQFGLKDLCGRQGQKRR